MTVVGNPFYAKLAGKVLMRSLYLNAPATTTFSQTMQLLFNDGLLRPHFWILVEKHATILDRLTKANNDFIFDYFSVKTMMKCFLLRDRNGTIVETPQYMFMRAAIAINMGEREDFVPNVEMCYRLLSNGLMMYGAEILQTAGTVSVYSPMLTVDNSKPSQVVLMPYIGAYTTPMPMPRSGLPKITSHKTIYVEMWSLLIEILVKDNAVDFYLGNNNNDLRYMVLVPDLFMTRLENNVDWTLFRDIECDILKSSFGKTFNQHYLHFEKQKLGKPVNSGELWRKLIQYQMWTKQKVQIAFKDVNNRLSLCKNFGALKYSNGPNVGMFNTGNVSSIYYSGGNNVNLWNTAAIFLPKFINHHAISLARSLDYNLTDQKNSLVKVFNFDLLGSAVTHLVTHLNRLLDVCPYGLEMQDTRRYRALGISLQGMSDVFHILKIPYTSTMAHLLNMKIYETVYFNALQASYELADKNPDLRVHCYELERSNFPFNLLKIKMDTENKPVYNWLKLKSNILNCGIANLIMLGIAPTMVLPKQMTPYYNNCEAPKSNFLEMMDNGINIKKINENLYNTLVELNLWSTEMYQRIGKSMGSIEHIEDIPENVREIYKTVYDIAPKPHLNMASHRAFFIDVQLDVVSINGKDQTLEKMIDIYKHIWQNNMKGTHQII